VKALEVGACFEATQKDVKEVEQDFLTKLQEIREAVTKSGGTAVGGSKEMEALKAENEQLQVKNAKLEYRVQHMLKCMEELYSNQKQ